MAKTLPQCSHITRKRGIFYWRRRLPRQCGNEIALSLRTRHFREAEHSAALLDRTLEAALRRCDVLTAPANGMTINAILRQHLGDALASDRKNRIAARPYSCLYATQPALGRSAKDTDVEVLDGLASAASEALANRDKDRVRAKVAQLAETHGIAPEFHDELAIGLLEAEVHLLRILRDRTLGKETLVFSNQEASACAADCIQSSHVPLAPAGEDATPQFPPMGHSATPRTGLPASELVEAFFARRQSIDGATHQVMAQERSTLRRFIEAEGDRPMNAYGRADMTRFIDLLRRLPANYGRSPTDKTATIGDLIARAEATNAPRMKDKTVKRHISALSQFFRFGVDGGHITETERVNLIGQHRFRAQGKANQQRGAWTPEELTKLFSSPLWARQTQQNSRSQSSAHQPARFWLPILALYHGARLEEFADLYRRDIRIRDGIWIVSISDTNRRLKNQNAIREVPLHPEVIRLGFLSYANSVAPTDDSPLFPDIAPQGKDRKRGPRITRWFVDYRKQIGLYRPGIGMHAFRHTAITRITDAITSEQQRRHRDFIMGHARPAGEGNERYDKGPGLAAAAATLALLTYPEIDLSHHYAADTGDQSAGGGMTPRS